MIEVPFTKFHGAENDFLLTWATDRLTGMDLPQIARRICQRNTGIGGDGWMLVERAPGGLRTRLFNSDGSEPEISGNGTRCAAALALIEGAANPPDIVITTAAGPKRVRLIDHEDNHYLFEMDMGSPAIEELHASLHLSGERFDAAILNVGNPQCAIFVDHFPENWLAAAREVERHTRFPRGSNVSFVRALNRHTVEALFFERGAGETRSSGTGSTGAGIAAILRGVADSPVEIKTPAGSLHLRWEDSVFLTGPAEVIGEGRFFLEL